MNLRLVAIPLILLLAACADSAGLGVARALFGYVPPPDPTTVAQELELEYERCVRIGKEKNCAQWAYDNVRVVKGLEPRAVPKGIVIILEGDGNLTDEDLQDDEVKDPPESQEQQKEDPSKPKDKQKDDNGDGDS